MIALRHDYAGLPERFFARQAPTPVAAPRMLALNAGLAADLGLDASWLAGSEGVAVLAGNAVPAGAQPIAQAYAGHQFGGWSPALGDGRAILLGEVTDRHGARQDVQLKGAGPTPYSRMGDGRAWLGPVLREFLVSEAMHGMGIPTTRALAAVATGETVLRETALPGAVLTRVAPSHVRVGTFQFFAARGDEDALAALAAFVRARHYPDATTPLKLLAAAVAAQARLIADWMAIGFIHGVMNTDNAHVAGITLDYGPCAFMDAYHPETVFSSIDAYGRYAYAAQPQIAVWNLAQFATCLLPLMGPRDAAVEDATAAVNGFGALYQDAWLARFRAKLGLTGAEAGDLALAEDLLTAMAATGADFTATFRGLAEGRCDVPEWAARWRERGPDAGLMRATNPAFIPRNHRVEAAIRAAVAGDMGPFERLHAVLARPFDDQPEAADLARPPAPAERVQRTFCGT